MPRLDERRDAPRRLDEGHYRAAADDALRRYPGPVGELLHRELCAYARFGHRFATGVDALIPLLTTHILTRSPGHEIAVTRPGPGPVLWPHPLRGRRPEPGNVAGQ